MNQLFNSLTRLVVLFAISLPGIAAEIIVRDDIGNTIKLAQTARRIVSLAPHTTELLFAAGAGDKVVGVVEYSDFPPKARSIQRIGNYSAFDLERISLLKPDLIIAWQSGNPASALARLQELGYPVFFSEPRVLGDIPETILQFATLAGSQREAQAAIDSYREQLQQLKTRYAGKETVTVFYEIWHQPMMTVNGQHIINEVIEFCGGRNVFANMSVLAPTVAVEPVLAANPQVIIASSSKGQAPEWLNDWRQWTTMDAVRYDNLFHIDADTINRHTPRILQGVEQICQALDIARQHIQIKQQEQQ